MADEVRVATAPAQRTAIETASDLDAALDAGLLTVVFQPVLSLHTGRVVAAESLVRLRRPGSDRLRTPDEFVPLAEATGRIARIDRAVVEAAVPLAVQWRALLDGHFSIGVNLSVDGLSDPTLPGFLASVCDRYGLPYDALVVEVTETVLSAPGFGHEDVLRDIADLGCNVTLDDFGTGYSSLSHLTRFPVAGIKIDRRFVWDIGRGGRGAMVPAALVRLGLDLGLHVVAEGVETAEQLELLQDVDCPFAQGFLLSKPLPAEELPAFLLRDPRGVPMPRMERTS